MKLLDDLRFAVREAVERDTAIHPKLVLAKLDEIAEEVETREAALATAKDVFDTIVIEAGAVEAVALSARDAAKEALAARGVSA